MRRNVVNGEKLDKKSRFSPLNHLNNPFQLYSSHSFLFLMSLTYLPLYPVKVLHFHEAHFMGVKKVLYMRRDMMGWGLTHFSRFEMLS